MPVKYCIYQTTPKSEYSEHYKISVHEAYLGYEDKKNIYLEWTREHKKQY